MSTPPYFIVYKRPGQPDQLVGEGIYSASVARRVRDRLAKSGEYVASDLVVMWRDENGEEHYL